MMCQMINICMFMGIAGMLHAGNEPENWHYVFLQGSLLANGFPHRIFSCLALAHSHHCIL